MSDADLRALERAAKTDPAAHVRHRVELVRLGRAAEAGLELGDVTVYRGHRQRIVERSQVGLKDAKGNGSGGRRVRIECADEVKHVRHLRSDGSSYFWCPHEDRAGGMTNLDSKRVGVLVEPANPPGERLPVGGAAKPPAWREATPIEVRAMLALSRARFAPATAPKRFARSMGSQVRYSCVACREDPHASDCEERGMAWTGDITEKQAPLLWRLCWTYRRSIEDADVLAEAEHRMDS